MERRARRWRLPLAVRIGAVPALVALAGALAFGFSQSDAAPAAANQNQTGYRAADFNGANLTDLPRGQDLPVSFRVGFECSGSTCRYPTGKIQVLLRKDDGNFGYWQGEANLTDHWSYERPGSIVAVVRSATISIPGDKLQPGKYRLHHYYGGDQFFQRAEQDQSVDPLLTVSSTFRSHFQMSTSPNPSKAGEPVTLSASYDGAPVGALPSGKVFFYLNGSYFSGARLKDGKASYNTKNSGKSLPVGQSTWSVRYLGDSKFREGESPAWTHTVDQKKIETTTALTIEPNPTVAGAPTHAKVKVTAKSGTAVPTGNVTVKFGGYTPVTGPLRADGTATFDRGLAPAGEHTATASYEPTGDFAPSESAEVKITVNKADTTTAVTADPQAIEVGKAVNFSVKVDPPAGNPLRPVGKVTYRAGDTEIGICELTDSSCDNGWGMLQPGKYTVTYEYSGDGNFNPSSGSTTVRWFLGSTTKLTASPSAVTAGSPVTLTAQVAGADPKVKTPFGGKVTFRNGTTELGKADVDKDGKATFTASGLAVGSHNLTAKFEGSDALDPSTSEKVAVQVNAAGTPGQGGGSQNGGSQGGSQNGGATGGSNPQPKNLASTGADIGTPLWGGAALVILGAVALTLTRRRRVRKSR